MADSLKPHLRTKLSEGRIRPIEITIEEQFFHRAAELLRDSAWASYRKEIHGMHGPRLAVGQFTARYTDLLVWAFSEYVDLLWKFVTTSDETMQWSEVEQKGFKFAERFIIGAYHHPWTGAFLTHQSWISGQAAMQQYRRLHETAPFFGEELFPEWQRIFENEAKSGQWRYRAIERAKERIALSSGTTPRFKRESASSKQAPIELYTLQEIRNWQIISQVRAAELLDCDPRTIHNYIKQNKLTKTPKGKVMCDDKLVRFYRLKYPHVRLM